MPLARAALADRALAPLAADLARLVGARLMPEEIAEVLRMTVDPSTLKELASGIRLRGRRNLEVPAAREPLERLLTSSSAAVREAAGAVAGLLKRVSGEELNEAVRTATDGSRPAEERARFIRLLGSGEFLAVAPTLAGLLDPNQEEPVQQAALAALDAHADPGVVRILADRWRHMTPGVRTRAVQVLLARKDRLAPLLEALRGGSIPAASLDGPQRQQLLNFPDPAITKPAAAVFGVTTPDPKRLERFRGALELAGEPARGEPVFRKLCLSCHRVGKEGVDVGPPLTTVTHQTKEQLLQSIVEPNLSVLPTYVQYVVEAADGRILNGVIVSDGGAGVTLRRQGGEDVTVLRRDIRALASSQASAMPEDLLKGVEPQAVADLLEFLKRIR